MLAKHAAVGSSVAVGMMKDFHHPHLMATRSSTHTECGRERWGCPPYH